MKLSLLTFFSFFSILLNTQAAATSAMSNSIYSRFNKIIEKNATFFNCQLELVVEPLNFGDEKFGGMGSIPSYDLLVTVDRGQGQSPFTMYYKILNFDAKLVSYSERSGRGLREVITANLIQADKSNTTEVIRLKHDGNGNILEFLNITTNPTERNDFKKLCQ